MKTCLVAINSKYIHSNLAVYSLQAFAASRGHEVNILEFTINQTREFVLEKLFLENADIYAFSVYIWNIEFLESILPDLAAVRPGAAIWLGGPEVSYDARQMLARFPFAAGIMRGEGEETFAELLDAYGQSSRPDLCSDGAGFRHGCDTILYGQSSRPDLCSVRGITFRSRPAHDAIPGCPVAASHEVTPELPCSASHEGAPECSVATSRENTSGHSVAASHENTPGLPLAASHEGGEIMETEERAPMNMDDLPFPYEGREFDPNRIYYYESSRGCPFHCSYCLSSVEKCLRFRSIDTVRNELRHFLDAGIRQVKFVDRTFNCNPVRARELWQFIKEHDNGVTNFHFEIGADLLGPEDIEILASLRPGQVQLEIGVQTTNPETMNAINRVSSWEKLSANVSALLKARNIHIHLDLIAGLPFEDLASFRKSFDDVYGLHPLQLQLGFLKVLKGTPMQELADSGSRGEWFYSPQPPYEVLRTPWLTYADIVQLKGVEEMVELYYNSRQFEQTIAGLEEYFGSPYRLYLELSEYFKGKHYDEMKHSRIRTYEILLEFITEKGFPAGRFIPLLLEDAYARERLKHFPEWGKGYEKAFEYNYGQRNPLTGNAARV